MPDVSPGMAQFLQALKNNLESVKVQIEATPVATAGSSSTTIISGGSGGNAPPSIVDYGGLGDGTSDNDAAFALAEASTFDEIYIPSGVFKAFTRSQSQFNKGYWGPGTIKLADGTTMPGQFSYIASQPLGSGLGVTGWFGGDSRASRGAWFMIGPGSRKSLAANYYNQLFQPNSTWMHVYDGGSGTGTTVTVASAPGAVTVNVLGTTPELVGKTVGLAPQQDGPWVETAVVQSVTANTITFAAPLANGWPRGTVISASKRTNTSKDYVLLRNFAEGDAICNLMRVEQRYQPDAGKKHVFETSTVGLYGGDISFVGGSSGSMATAIEYHINDQGNDVCAIGVREEYNRTLNAAPMGAFWVGHLISSIGTKPIDACFALQGRFSAVLDTVIADLTQFNTAGDNLNAVLNTALGHRWIMNSTAQHTGRSTEPWGLSGPWFGNTPGDMYIESGTDGISDFIALRFNRASPNDCRLRVRPTAVQINRDLNVAQAVSAGTDVSVGATGKVFFGAGSGNYITFSGGNFNFFKANVLTNSF